MRKITCIVFFIIVSDYCYAGRIRNITVNEKQMHPVYLMLGQSTVVRFKEAPKKIVVGNQNYFNIEFIDNDITIQPLGVVSTNLFVYTESHIYGFKLNVTSSGHHDDLITANWGYAARYRLSTKPVERFESKKIILNFDISEAVSLKFYEIKHDKQEGFYVVDALLINKSKKILNTNDLRFELSIYNKSLPYFIYSAEQEQLSAGENCRLRVLFAPKEKHDFTIHVVLGPHKTSKIIPRAWL